MDIVNWDALQKGLLIRDTIENPNDIVLIGANTTYNKRGDKFQTYAVPVSVLTSGGGGGGGITQLTGDVTAGPGTGSVASSIAVNAVTAPKIAANAVTGPKIATDAVTTTKILDANVTYGKIQNVAANTFLANATASDATVQEISTSRIPLFGSAIGGTPSATTYLRGDGSWQTPPTGSGGGALAVVTATINVERTNNLSPSPWDVSTADGSLIKITTANGGSGWTAGTGGSYNILSGLAAKPAGAVATIVNSGTNNLLIIEHNNVTDSTSANVFKMIDRMAYFVMPGRSVSFYYDGTAWIEMAKGNTGGFDYFDDYLAAGILNGNNYNMYTGSPMMTAYIIGGSLVAGFGTNPAPEFTYGALGLSTGVLANGSASVNMMTSSINANSPTNNFSGPNTQRPILALSRWRMQNLPTAVEDFTFALGFQWNFSAAVASSYSGGAPHWASGYVMDTFANNATNELKIILGGVQTSAVTPIIVSANTWYTTGQYVDPAGTSSYFYFDGNSSPVRYKFAGFRTIPSGIGGGYGVGITKTVGTTARIVGLDYTGISVQTPLIYR